MSQINLVQGDTKPSVYVVIDDPQTREPLDLTGATAQMHFRAVGSTTLKATVAGTLLTGFVEADGSVTTTSPYNVAGAGGRIRFDWGATDLDTAGYFEGEIEITFSDASVQTTFETLRFFVRDEFA